MRRSRVLPFAAAVLGFGLLLSGCGGGGGKNKPAKEDDDDNDTTTTYSISGTYTDSSKYSFSAEAKMLNDFGKAPVAINARTACNDGQYYAIYCLSISAPPVAAEGDIDCAGSGAFTVAGLPKGSPIVCSLVRYDSATAEDPTAIVGSILIPSTSLSGTTETIVSSGDMVLNVAIDEDGTVGAEVVSGKVDAELGPGASNFIPTNVNGVWLLECSSNAGGSEFSAGKCKCFLGNPEGAGYSNQDDCMEDDGADIVGPVRMPVGIYLYKATVNEDIPMEHGEALPEGSSVTAISIWGAVEPKTAKAFVSLKGSGGEGVDDMGGKLTWATTPDNPTTDIAWYTSDITIKDGEDEDVTFTVPSFAKKGGKVAPPTTHSGWMTWLQAVVDAAQADDFDCTRGPTANAHDNTNGDLKDNIECINQVLEGMRDLQINLPRLRLRPFCDKDGCRISADAADNSENFYHADALNIARIEFEQARMDYPEPWTSTPPVSDPELDSNNPVGVGAAGRFVFEPLMYFPGGAGFRQKERSGDRFKCDDVAKMQTGGEQMVTNAACSDNMSFYELNCHTNKELSIKFIGNNAPYNVLFEQTESVVFAELVKHSMGGRSIVSPTGTNALAMCLNEMGGGKGKFFAKATKQ